MRLPHTFWLDKRLAVSCIISTPSLVQICLLLWSFIDTEVGYSERLAPLLITFFILSLVCFIAGVIHFAVALGLHRVSWDVITCLVITTVCIIFDVFDFLHGMFSPTY